MNWLSIAVIGLIAFYTWRGYHNGLIKTVFFIFSFFIALILASIISPIVSKQLQQNEIVFNTIKNGVASNVKLGNEADTDPKDKEPTQKSDEDEQKSINDLPLPDILKQVLAENNDSNAYQAFKVTNFNDYLACSITTMIINALSYIIVFSVIRLLIRILAGVANIIGNLPVIHTINKAGGIAIGFLHGICIIWILCIILMVSSGTESGKQIFIYVEQSPLLTWIYNNNLIMNVLQDTFNGLLSGII